MFPRAVIGIVGSLPLAFLGAALVAVASSSPPDFIATVAFGMVGFVVSVLSPTTAAAGRRLLACTGAALLALSAASYTFGTASQGFGPVPVALLALAGLAGAALLVWGLSGHAAATGAYAPPRDTGDDHSDQLSETATYETTAPRNYAYLSLAAAAAACVLLVLGWRSATNPPDVTIESITPPVATSAAPAPAAAAAAAEETVPVPALPTAAEASAARRECMAQIEIAHLFQTLARTTATAQEYDAAVDVESKRLLKQKPIGPRTLKSLSSHVWARRTKPEPAAIWWSRQYQRCEAQRSTGAAYTVRSD